MVVGGWSAFGTAHAAAVLSITPITWNVIGLDSNNVLAGPDTFPVGARICNTGSTAATGVTAQFFFDGGKTNPYINLLGLQQLNLGTLAAGATPPASSTIQGTPSNCVDAYFNVIVTRNAGAYSSRISDTATPTQRNTQQYHITATATGLGALSIPTPRELYVEKLISQGRNSVGSFVGPASVSVGQVAQYTLNASTATQGYEQLENFPVLPNSIFQIIDVKTTYAAPSGAVNSTTYADACGWENNPSSANYHNNGTCIGPANYTGGKASANARNAA
ncbi:hypothetical protein GCM10008957_33520 [Deinococcus ruber]|uniref:Uncharacterized protein n=1 Tax=Deinococcus ruber TaxID=1848197 RepID=A0A918CD01_9DEIO|nr:hypothetical protein GCM10008957_33520 [Deinococcus ruber]